MGTLKSKNTHPELLVRKYLFSKGYRYNINVKKLPGKPDIVFKSRKKIIFVNGCFWHKHTCKKGSIPKTNHSFWKEKLNQNVLRDRKNYLLLKSDGWDIKIIWECELKDFNFLTLTEWLNLKSEKGDYDKN